jgi:hypothetical protein
MVELEKTRCLAESGQVALATASIVRAFPIANFSTTPCFLRQHDAWQIGFYATAKLPESRFGQSTPVPAESVFTQTTIGPSLTNA